MSCRTRGCGHVERVAAAGEVHVVARVVGRQPIIGGVVDAAHRERRPQLVALGGVVVDHVEDHLDAGGVHGPDHHLELLHGVLRNARCSIVGLGGEEAERVVAPVIGQPLLEQVAVVEVVVHRQELDGGDAQVVQVLDGRLRRQPGVGAAQFFGHLRVAAW